MTVKKPKNEERFFFEAFVGVPGDPVDADKLIARGLGVPDGSLGDTIVGLCSDCRGEGGAVDVSAVWAVETLLTDPLAAWDESSEDALRNNSFGM